MSGYKLKVIEEEKISFCIGANPILKHTNYKYYNSKNKLIVTPEDMYN